MQTLKTFIIVVLIFAWVYPTVLTVEADLHFKKLENRITKLEQELGKIQNIHIYEDRSHQTCKYDCDCNGLKCDTL